MKKRLTYLGCFFASILGYFLLQKPVFMLYNGACEKGTAFTDYLRVLFHGFTLDAATTGYLTAIPWPVIMVERCVLGFPLKKILIGYYVLISLATTLIFIGDMALYPFWGFKLDASIFLYLDSPKNAMASVSLGFILIRLLCILILSALVTWGLYKITPANLPQVQKRIAGSLITILLGGVIFIIIRGGVTESTSNVGQAYFCNDEFLNHSAINPDFSLLSSISKTTDFAQQFNFFDEEKRADLFEGLYADTGENEVSLLTTNRPNVLIILMEGFGGVFVESLGGVPDVSPNLERLSKEGVFFTNCYANSFRTDRGTVCTFSGYQSFPTVSVMKSPAKSRTLPSIAEKLREQGYATDFLYGGDINFTNMKSYLLGSGYQHLTADVDFSMEERKNPWGVNDDITFEYLYRQIKERNTNQPWHTAFLTLSSHEPFEVPYSRLANERLNAFAYTDSCIGDFVKQFRRLPQWKNTAVVLVPDHLGAYPERIGNLETGRYRIPLLIVGGAVRGPERIGVYGSQQDIAATLLAQLSIPHGEFTFSKDMLNPASPHFAFFTVPDAFGFLTPDNQLIFNNEADAIVVDEGPKKGQNLSLGQAYLQKLYDDIAKR